MQLLNDRKTTLKKLIFLSLLGFGLLPNAHASNPTANAGSNKSVCVGDSVPIGGNPTATGGVGVYTYSWKPAGSLSSATVANPKASPAAVRVYTVTVTDAAGHTASSSMKVTVNPLPDAIVGDNKTECGGVGVKIGNVVEAQHHYAWEPTTGLSDPTLHNPIANPSVSTTYTLTATLTKTGCSNSHTVSVTVTAITLSGNAAVCKGGVFSSLPYSAISNAPDKYSINYNAAAVAAGFANVALTALPPSPIPISVPAGAPAATYTATITVTNKKGCSGPPIPFAVKVNPLPLLGSFSNHTICRGDSVDLDPVLVEDRVFQWNPANGLSSATVPSPMASPLANTTYTLTETIFNTGCSNSGTVSVTVNPLPIVNAGSNASVVCPAGNTVIGTNASAGSLYLWSPATGLTSDTLSNPVANPSANTTYTLTETLTATHCSNSNTVSVTVRDTIPPVALCKNISVTLDSSGHASILADSINNGSSDNCAIAGMSVYPSAFNCINAGLDTVTLTVTDVGGNTATCTSKVLVINNNLSVNIIPNGSTALNTGDTLVLTAYPFGFAHYLWSTGDTMASIRVSSIGGYAVSVTDSNGCKAGAAIQVTTNTTAACQTPFISEYLEGGSLGNNKAIELFNPTSNPYPLTDYEIQLWTGDISSGITMQEIPLAGDTIPALSAFVIANTGAAAQILSVANVITPLNYNGTNAIVLFQKSTYSIIDVIGQIGVNPGSGGWAAAGGASTVGYDLLRMPTVLQGTSNWAVAQNQYYGYQGTYFDNLGRFQCDCSLPDPTLSLNMAGESSSGNTYLFDITATSPDDEYLDRVLFTISYNTLAFGNQIASYITPTPASGNYIVTIANASPCGGTTCSFTVTLEIDNTSNQQDRTRITSDAQSIVTLQIPIVSACQNANLSILLGSSGNFTKYGDTDPTNNYITSSHEAVITTDYNIDHEYDDAFPANVAQIGQPTTVQEDYPNSETNYTQSLPASPGDPSLTMNCSDDADSSGYQNCPFILTDTIPTSDPATAYTTVNPNGIPITCTCPANNGTGIESIGNSLVPTADASSDLKIIAGVGQTITINGCQFGSIQGNGGISFPNADVGGTNSIQLDSVDYTFWSDTKITFTFPSAVGIKQFSPGSGLLMLTNNDLDSTAYPFNIYYGIENVYSNTYSNGTPITKARLELYDDQPTTEFGNPTGGYLYNILGGTAGNAAIVQAFNDWACYTGVNFQPIVAEGGRSYNAAMVINYVDSIPDHPSALAETTIKNNNYCSSSNVLIQVPNISILINPSPDGVNAIWHYTIGDSLPAGQVDFYAVVLHEIGHALGLTHVDDPSEVMYYKNHTLGPLPPDKRLTLNRGNNGLGVPAGQKHGNAAIDGGNDEVNASQPPFAPYCNAYIMQLYTPSQCNYTDGIRQTKSDNYNLELYPNPFSNSATLLINGQLKLHNAELRIVDLSGRQVRVISVTEQSTGIDGSNLAAGMYIFKLNNNNELIGTGKFIITDK